MAISKFARFRGGPTPPRSPAENPNPGTEIVQHLVAHLPKLGVVIVGTEDVEYAHEIKCDVNGKNYTVIVGYDWIAEDWWEVFYAPRLSWLKRLLGHSEEEEMRALTSAIAAALGKLPQLGEVRWYRAYGATARTSYSTTPEC